MSKTFCYRQYRPGDEEEIIELLEMVFNGWPHFDLNCINLEHWNWKYKKNPLKMIDIELSLIDDKIIGCYHRIPQRIKIGDEIALCHRGSDLAVHPDFRNMGISTKMIERFNEKYKEIGVQIVFHFSINPILITSWEKKYSVFPHDIVNLVKIKDIKLHLHMMKSENVLFKRIGFHTLKLINYLRNVFISSESLCSLAYINILEIKKFDYRIDDFWDEVSKQYNFIVERNKDYLNWRYCNHLGGDYLIKIAEKDGKILGYIVLRINKSRQDYFLGYVIDILVLPDHLDVANALIIDAINYFECQGINRIDCWVIKDSPYERIFKQHMFIDIMNKFQLFYNPIDVGLMDEIENIPSSQLHFVMGDTDYI